MVRYNVSTHLAILTSNIAYSADKPIHLDLAVTIHDDAAAFNHYPGKPVLDYEPQLQ